MHATTRRAAAALALVTVLAACGGGEEPTPDPTEAAAAPTEAAATETTEDPGGKDEPTIAPDAPTPPPAPTADPAGEPTAPPAPTLPPAPPAAPADSGAMGDVGTDMGAGGAATYDSYTTITDDTGAIQLEVPTEWTDIDGRPYNDDQGRQLFDVRASTDLQGFNDTWDVPGVIVTASREVAQTENEVTLLDEVLGPLSGVCTYLGREPYDDGLYVGQFDVYDVCGGTQTGYIVLGAVPSSRAFVIRVQVQVVEERDIEALGRALNSFVIVGDV